MNGTHRQFCLNSYTKVEQSFKNINSKFDVSPNILKNHFLIAKNNFRFLSDWCGCESKVCYFIDWLKNCAVRMVKEE